MKIQMIITPIYNPIVGFIFIQVNTDYVCGVNLPKVAVMQVADGFRLLPIEFTRKSLHPNT